MTPKPILYGWHLSYYTGKVLCYLRYKRIPFVDQPVNLFTLTWRIKRKTGEVVMPVLVTSEGEWLQDSSAIIDHMEAQHPLRPIIPQTPVQRFATYLMEAWGDEWWVPIAMHTRWTYPENYALFERDAGTSLLPHFPAWMQRRAVARIAQGLRSYLPGVGVRPAQFAVMDAWTATMLDLLNQHFAQQAYLFGDHPTLGDFGLVGTMFGHLGRDPWPARELIDPRPHLQQWIKRMACENAPTALTAPTTGERLLPNDTMAPTLTPIFRTILKEFLPMMEKITAQVNALKPQWPPGKPLPRALGDIDVPMGAGVFHRSGMPYTLWMAQRTLDVFQAMTAAEQGQVHDWLASMDGEALLNLDLPRLRRQGLRVVLD